MPVDETQECAGRQRRGINLEIGQRQRVGGLFVVEGEGIVRVSVSGQRADLNAATAHLNLPRPGPEKKTVVVPSGASVTGLPSTVNVILVTPTSSVAVTLMRAGAVLHG